MSCKHIFILQLPEDKTKNYIGVLSEDYSYSSSSLCIKQQHLTHAVMKHIKAKLLSLGMCSST